MVYRSSRAARVNFPPWLSSRIVSCTTPAPHRIGGMVIKVGTVKAVWANEKKNELFRLYNYGDNTKQLYVDYNKLLGG